MMLKKFSLAFLLVFCVAITGVANGTMILHLPLDSDLTDTTGNFTGVTAGGDAAITTLDSAVGIGALALDGTGDFLDVADSVPVGTSDFTVAMWLNLNDKRGTTSADRHQLVLNGDTGTDASATTQIFVERDGTLGFYASSKEGSVFVDFTDEFSNGTVDDSNAITGSDWRHIAVVVDRSSDPGNLVLSYYIDGLFDTTITKSFSASASLTPTGGTDNSFYLGYSSYHSGRGTDGLMDDVRLYNEALTAAQIGDIVSVPEPSTLVLLLGMIFAGFAFRKK